MRTPASRWTQRIVGVIRQSATAVVIPSTDSQPRNPEQARGLAEGVPLLDIALQCTQPPLVCQVVDLGAAEWAASVCNRRYNLDLCIARLRWL
ncbi:hypothetical protein OA010_01125 [Luminiphilus sp.]|nr:hypothetical protein [Luminiphilus sp.]